MPHRKPNSAGGSGKTLLNQTLLSGAQTETHIGIHASETIIIFVDPSITGLNAGSGITSIFADPSESRARRSLEWGVYCSYIVITSILQLFVIAPVIGHKTDDALGEVLAGNDEHEQPIEGQQHVLVAMAIPALAQYLLKVHGQVRRWRCTSTMHDTPKKVSDLGGPLSSAATHILPVPVPIGSPLP